MNRNATKIRNPFMQGSIGLLILLSFQCATPDIGPSYVDPDLNSYFSEFQLRASEHGLAEHMEIPFSLAFTDISTEAHAGLANRKNHTILIDQAYRKYPLILEYLVYHECGHYFFKLEHNTSLIMLPELDTDNIKLFAKDREKYIAEFFNSVNKEVR